MATATTDADASRELTIHAAARDTLTDLPARARDRLTETLTDVAATRQPSSHKKVKHLHNNNAGLLRVRVGDWRAVVEVVNPELRVLRVSKRNGAYDERRDSELDRRRS